MSSKKIIKYVEQVEIKSCFINKIFSFEQILQLFFWLKCFHQVWLLRHCREEKWKRDLYSWFFIYLIYIYIYIYTYIYLFILYIYCMYMSVNVEMELPMWQGKRHVFSCSALNSVLLLLYQSASPNTSTPKIDFFLNPVFSYFI